MYQSKNGDINRRILEIGQEVRALENGTALSKVYDEQNELERLLGLHGHLVMIMANIGVGKSTAAKVLSTHGRGRLIPESVDNPLLREYYTEWAKHNRGECSQISPMTERLQIDLMNRRLHQIIIERLRHPNESLVFDRSHYEDLTFIEALTESNILTPEQTDFLRKYFGEQKQSLEGIYSMNLTPDLLVFLRRNFETGWSRVEGRNREMEVGGGLSREFYKRLHDEYEKLRDPNYLIERFRYNGPIAVLGCEDVDVTDLSSSKGILYLIRSVKEALRIAYES